MLLLVVAGNDLEESIDSVPGAIRDRYFTTESGPIVHLNMNEYEAQIQRMFRSGQWVTTRRGRLHVISASIEENQPSTSTGGGTRQITDTDESQPSTLGWTGDAMSLGDATPNITLPSDISEETLIAAADRAIAEASTFTDEAI
ncbi:hypothetical protein J6590_089417 [Homalodisca vitripennis]|nr:hypothetical protein J6590_086685 [Homalodisca vitripennis]KAG8324558.1 hypothetical protein J6590_089417 [Homalodisca vitripennis]